MSDPASAVVGDLWVSRAVLVSLAFIIGFCRSNFLVVAI